MGRSPNQQSSWKDVVILDSEADVAEACEELGVVEASHGLVGERDANEEVVLRRLQKQTRQLGGDHLQVFESVERIRVHDVGFKMTLRAKAYRCH